MQGTTAIDASADVSPETSVQAAVEAAGERFVQFVASLDEPEALLRRRREAWERYARLPMPTRNSEEWRYTDLGGLEPECFEFGAPAESVGFDRLPEEVQSVVERSHERSGIFVQRDGAPIHARLEPALAERGVVLASIADAARQHPELLEKYLYAGEVADAEAKFWNLHVAALSGGYLLYVPADVRLEHPVHAFRHIDRGGILASVHTLVVAEPGSEVTCIDEYTSSDLESETLSVSGVEIVGAANADVHYVSLQRYGRGVRHFTIQHVTGHRDTRIHGFNVTLGGDLSRADVSSRLVGAGAESIMLALWFADDDQHVDHQTLQDHVAPHAHSDLLYKGALTDAARSVFRGLIRVRPGAQLTDAYQTNRNLLLSKDANATALPNLEIEADDVRCSHGATIGQVEARQLFYMMSRGLSREQAERLLVFGFFDEALGRLTVEGVRDRVRSKIAEKLGV